LSASCASAPSQPRTFAFVRIEAGAPRPSGRITSYPRALEAVLWVMENRLGFPRLSGSLELYPSHASMALGLEGAGYEPSYAVRIAGQLDGITRPGHIFANDAALRWQRWPARIAFLAHELTHVAEYALAGGRRGSSRQWLREGLAEWASWRVVDALGLGSYQTRRRAALLRLRQAHDRRTLPAFRELVAQSAWSRNVNRHALDPAYDQPFLATESLIEGHGLPTVLDYFAMFARSDDALANFRAAFGEDAPHFEAAFQARLNRLLE
jgi:hypothetical protein